MKKFLILFLLLFSVNAWADTTVEFTIPNTAADGVYVVASGTPTWVNDTTPLLTADDNAVGQVTSMDFVNVKMSLYFALSTESKSIPANQEIVTAYISLFGNNIGVPMTDVKASIYLENDATSANISDLTSYATKRANAIAGSVIWDDATINTNNYNNTPELKTLVQTLADAGQIDRLLFFVDPTAGCSDPGVYAFKTGKESAEFRPKITITYKPKTAGGGTKLPWRIP